MDWSVLRTSLDVGLNHSGPEIEFIFSGGEPLLEMPLIRRAVDYVQRHRQPSLDVRFSVLTNGTLLDEQSMSFLVRHDVETQISFDGVPESQDLRAAGSFDVLDGCLDHMRAFHPGFYRRRLNIATVITPQSLPNLSRSVVYFLEKGVQTVVLVPDFTAVDGWHKADIERLDEVFSVIFEHSRRHHRETGEIPLRIFRSPPRDPPAGTLGRSLCGIMRGEKPAVDPEGQVFGCGAVVNSYQDLPAAPVRASLQKIRLGHIEDPRLPERLANFRNLTRPVGLFDNKQHNWSSYGRCGDCKYLYDCSICPVTIGYVTDNEDMKRVPDFPCAYNLVTFKYREKFWALRARAGSDEPQR